jgi:hypothetical protein
MFILDHSNNYCLKKSMFLLDMTATEMTLHRMSCFSGYDTNRNDFAWDVGLVFLSINDFIYIYEVSVFE